MSITVTVKDLLEAVRANDLEQIRAIVAVRPELLNTVEAWNNEYTALHYAVLRRMPEMVRVLMELGADARAGIHPHPDASGALTIATEREYTEIAAVIREVEKQRWPERPGMDDVPADLWTAIRAGDEERALEILQFHPELAGARNPGNGWTLLHVASALLFSRMAAWLLERGADVNEQSKDGSTPLDVAGQRCGAGGSEDRRSALVRLLLGHGAELTARSAVMLGDAGFLLARHEEGALAVPLDEQGWLLRVAVDCNRPGMLQLLLRLGLDPDARVRVEGVDEIAFTWGMPLYQCARYGKHKMAETLLDRGADPNAQVYASGTPLSEAYGQRDGEMVALLERYGGKSNATMAGFYRRKDLAERLLAEHGDTKLPDDGFGSGPVAEQLLGAAARGGDPDILRMAMERVDWPNGDARWQGLLRPPLELWNHWIGPWCHHEWDRSTYLTCFRLILGRGGVPDGRHRFGATILHEVVATRDHVTAEERVAFGTMLLDAGAPLDTRDDLLMSTPLGWACRWGRDELVRLFLDRGADAVEAGAEPWATPLAWAKKTGRHAALAMLRP